MVAHEDRERVHPESIEQWRAWLADHHESSGGVWLVGWRTSDGGPRLRYEDTVVEAVAVGWVDSIKRVIDDDRSMLWFAPRRPASGWARPNKERVALLEEQGRMLPAGRRAVEVAKTNGAWSKLDDVENLVVPADLAAALAARPGAAEQWEAFPRSVKRGILEWIVQARTEPTRVKRVTETADKAERGERAHQWQRT